MPNLRTLLRSFAGGEISPEFFGRIDAAIYQTGAARLRNFISKPQGPAQRRPGFKLVRAVKDSTKQVRVLTFNYSPTQNLAIEMGAGYFRFHRDGATLTYTTPNAYVGAFQCVGDSITDQVVTSSAHSFVTGDPVYFYVTGGALAAPLQPGVRYFATFIDSTHIQVSATAGGPAINITSAGTGTQSVARVYDQGDMTSFGGLNRYCRKSTLGVAPHPATDVVYWYTLPMSPNIYEIPNSYTESQLFEITTDQSFDVMSLAHQGSPFSELRRHGETRWVFATVAFSSSVGTPPNVQATATRGAAIEITGFTSGAPATFSVANPHFFSDDDPLYIFNANAGAGAGFDLPDGHYIVRSVPTSTTVTLKKVVDGANVLITTPGSYSGTNPGRVQFASLSSTATNHYKVTSIGADGTESDPSSEATVENNLFVSGAKNTITWTAVPGAVRYNVYKKQTGLFGYIGQVNANETLAFDDDNIGPDLGTTPPIVDTTLSGTDYPGAVGHFEQRRVFAGTPLEPQKVWLTKSGSESDLNYALPIQDSDRIAFRVAARQNGTIRHVVSLQHLLLLSSSAEYRVTPINSDALTPATVSVRPQSYIGASHAAPVVVNNTIVFCADRGGHVREMGWNINSDGFATGNLSLRAAHLFDDTTIRDVAYQKSPLPILWFTSSSGLLLGLTYVPEEKVGGWHVHDTDGVFESVCAVTEGDEERLYVVVRRGSTRYIERSDAQKVVSIAASCFLDSAVTYSGAATSVISGLDHLEGEVVSILADGLVQPPQEVSGGTITLGAPAAIVHVGLPYRSHLLTPPLLLASVDGASQGRTKNLNKLWVRAFESAQFLVGPENATVPVFRPNVLQDGEVQVTLPASWTDGGQLSIEQSDPVPLTVVGLTLEVAVGG